MRFLLGCVNAANFDSGVHARAGLAIYQMMPTTLGVGVALVAAARGNQGVAVLLTVGTNMAAILTMPLFLKLVFGSAIGGAAISIDIPKLFLKLLLTILVPAIVGKVSRICTSCWQQSGFGGRHLLT